MINHTEFESVCKKIQPDYYYKKYKLIGSKKAEPTHWLKLPFQKIAVKYLYHEHTGINRILFPGEIVQRIAKELDVYVTDLIRYRK